MQCLLNPIDTRFLLFTSWEELEVRIEMREIGCTWRTQSPEFPNVNEPPLLPEVAPPPRRDLNCPLGSVIPLLSLSRPITRACSHVNYEVKSEEKTLDQFANFYQQKAGEHMWEQILRSLD